MSDAGGMKEGPSFLRCEKIKEREGSTTITRHPNTKELNKEPQALWLLYSQEAQSSSGDIAAEQASCRRFGLGLILQRGGLRVTDANRGCTPLDSRRQRILRLTSFGQYDLLHPEHTHVHTQASSHGEGAPAYMITSASKEQETVWGQVTSYITPRRVAPELLDLEHVRVLPEAQLVLAEAVGRHKLLIVLRPLKGTHLHSRQHKGNMHACKP